MRFKLKCPRCGFTEFKAEFKSGGQLIRLINDPELQDGEDFEKTLCDEAESYACDADFVWYLDGMMCLNPRCRAWLNADELVKEECNEI